MEGAPALAKPKLARAQVPSAVTGYEEKHPEGTVNIWSGRRLKGYGSREKGPRVASKYKCQPDIDSGWTRGEGAGVSYCCLYYARGLCHHGADCNYLHRVPDEVMEVRHAGDHAVDIFGRDRNPASRDGRKRGTGSYERECKTLYVNYGGAGAGAEAVRRAARDAFAPWGPVDDVYIAAAKTLAFVRYRWRSSAEFAKAAMHQQTLPGIGGAEVLDVRWANDDPNPSAVKRVQREREEALRDAYVTAVNQLDPETKRARLQQLHLAATVRPGVAAAAYPDTDDQYGRDSPHEYVGWDEYYYQHLDETPGGAAALEAGAWRGALPQHEVPGTEEAEDDITRYLSPAELAELDAQGAGEDAEPESAAGTGEPGRPPSPSLGALLAGYGSDSEG